MASGEPNLDTPPTAVSVLGTPPTAGAAGTAAGSGWRPRRAAKPPAHEGIAARTAGSAGRRSFATSSPRKLRFRVRNASSPRKLRFRVRNASSPRKLRFRVRNASSPRKLCFRVRNASSPRKLRFRVRNASAAFLADDQAGALADAEGLQAALGDFEGVAVGGVGAVGGAGILVAAGGHVGGGDEVALGVEEGDRQRDEGVLHVELGLGVALEA